MIIQDIYSAFEKIGCLTFTTVDEKNQPVSRIAHLRGYDDDGLYFMTMFTKDFYKHIKLNNAISICGLCAADTHVGHDDDGMPVFHNGYAIRLSGKAQEISVNDLKSKNNPIFDMCIKDQQKYNAMVIFCINSGNGDIFDYDFAMEHRENKLDRIYFSYNGGKINLKGLKIDGHTCISCGVCEKKCSFKAISSENGKYQINPNRCDECGDCYINCPVKAISY